MADPIKNIRAARRKIFCLRGVFTQRITTLTDLMLHAYPPDVRIDIPRNTCSTFEFYKAKSLVELGREECLKALSRK